MAQVVELFPSKHKVPSSKSPNLPKKTTRNACDQKFHIFNFFRFWNICIYIDILKLVCVSYVAYTHSPKVLLYHIFSEPMF
jgi:hypothetical protein